ncbi:MAG: CAP domain-containing protein [Pyrobaculum sp.]
MSRLKCERRSGYLVCYPYRRWVKRIVGRTLAALGAVVFLFLLVYLYVDELETFRLFQSAVQTAFLQTSETSRPAQPVAEIIPQPTAKTIAETYSQTPEIKTSRQVQPTTRTTTPQTPEVENEASKLQAVEYLNRIRGEEGIPPVQLINLSVVKFRAEYLARTDLFSHYDAEGRHPVYWYTRLDGGFYGVEENLMMVRGIGVGRLPSRIVKVNYTDAVYGLVFDDVLSMWGHRDSLLDPCHNYVAMATSYFWNITYGARYYVVYMVAKWVEWVSPPRYEGGRFTAEGYAAPAMKPKIFAVYYAAYEANPASRHSYSYGDLYLCKVLDTPFARCKDAQEPAGVFTLEKTQDSRWRIKIDASVDLDKPGLYTFMIIAEDLRGIKWKPMSPWGDARVGKCRIMGYTVAK